MEYSNKEFNSYKDLLDNEKDWKSKLYSNYKNKIDAQRELAAFALNFIKDNEKKIFSHDSPFFELASFFAAKAIKTFRAIQCLIENGYGEDAAVIIRCQFELVVNFLFISKEQRDKRAKKYINYCRILEKEFLNEISHSNLFGEIVQEMPKERKEKIERAYEEHEKSYRNKRKWSGKSIKDMANNIGLGGYYTLYKLWSNYVHTNVECSKDYIEEDDNIIKYKIGISDNLIRQHIVANGNFLLRILVQLNDIFHLDQVDIITEAENKFVKAFPKNYKIYV